MGCLGNRFLGLKIKSDCANDSTREERKKLGLQFFLALARLYYQVTGCIAYVAASTGVYYRNFQQIFDAVLHQRVCLAGQDLCVKMRFLL